MLTIEKLGFSYPGSRIFDEVNMQLDTHRVTCLVGGNGSGKTTLFNLITGFLRPDFGVIRLGNTEITRRVPYEIAQLGVARTFQDLRLIGKLSVRENVILAIPGEPDERLGNALLPSNPFRIRNVAARLKADKLLAEFFLEDIADRLASEISFGQQKLLTLACCIALDAGLFLLDEPVAGISPEYRERVAKCLVRLKSQGKTILLVEHQPDFLERSGDTFLYLQAGQLHQFETLAALRASPSAQDALN